MLQWNLTHMSFGSLNYFIHLSNLPFKGWGGWEHNLLCISRIFVPNPASQQSFKSSHPWTKRGKKEMTETKGKSWGLKMGQSSKSFKSWGLPKTIQLNVKTLSDHSPDSAPKRNQLERWQCFNFMCIFESTSVRIRIFKLYIYIYISIYIYIYRYFSILEGFTSKQPWGFEKT